MTTPLNTTFAFADTNPSRRSFLARLLAGSAALAIPSLSISGCNGDGVTDPTKKATLNFATDAGVLNYFYAITQLQADFWNRVNANRFPSITTAESAAFSALASHANGQRDWLLNYVTAGRITDIVVFSFNQIDFPSRVSTMNAALEIEDSASQGYAGGIQYLKSAANVTLAAKLGSVAARHSAVLRDLNDVVNGGTVRSSFAADGIMTASGLETASSPSTVIATLDKYFGTEITIQGA